MSQLQTQEVWVKQWVKRYFHPDHRLSAASGRVGRKSKRRLTMIPPMLAPALSAHRERLRELHKRDREAGLPGVELPEALERKWPKAGEKFIWFWFWPSRNLMRDQRDSGACRAHDRGNGNKNRFTALRAPSIVRPNVKEKR